MKQRLPLVDYMKERARQIDMHLRDSLVFSNSASVPEKLAESMKYSLMAGGKRLRPMLVLASTEAFGGSIQAAMPVACAIEMIHTYSLIHDDLPAMDNDDYRRGKLTNHKVFGAGMAILGGDALLTHAFYTAVQAFRAHRIPAEHVLTIVEELSLFAGAGGMVGGQAADLEGEQGVTDLEQLEFIHARKTSDLIVFSLRAGGRIGGANEAQLEALAEFGRKIGLAFQIRDDILDCIGEQSKLGKKTNSDQQLQKVTYPYLIGVEASRAKVFELTQAGERALLNAQIPNPDRLLELAEFLINREH